MTNYVSDPTCNHGTMDSTYLKTLALVFVETGQPLWLTAQGKCS